jgi:acyl-CoA thioester hydrolase
MITHIHVFIKLFKSKLIHWGDRSILRNAATLQNGWLVRSARMVVQYCSKSSTWWCFLKTVKEQIRVRWSETDSAGIVHFPNFFMYFEVAEQKLMREILNLDLAGASQSRVLRLPRVEAYCQYSSPARFDDLLEIELSVTAIGRSSITYAFSVFNKTTAKASASGRVKVEAVDENFRPVEIPSEVLELLK